MRLTFKHISSNFLLSISSQGKHFFDGTGVWTQGLSLARRVTYHLTYSASSRKNNFYIFINHISRKYSFHFILKLLFRMCFSSSRYLLHAVGFERCNILSTSSSHWKNKQYATCYVSIKTILLVNWFTG
jgi:hypothetical protein